MPRIKPAALSLGFVAPSPAGLGEESEKADSLLIVTRACSREDRIDAIESYSYPLPMVPRSQASGESAVPATAFSDGDLLPLSKLAVGIGAHALHHETSVFECFVPTGRRCRGALCLSWGGALHTPPRLCSNVRHSPDAFR